MTGEAPIPLRLLIVSRVVAAVDEDGTRFQALDGRYIDGIANAFRTTTVAAQVVVKGRNDGYENFAAYRFRFTAPNLSLFPLRVPRAASPGVVRTAWKQVRQAWALRGAADRCDLALLFLPAYTGSSAALWCRLKRRPYACYIGGDWVGYSLLAFRWSDWRKRLVQPYTWANGWLERRAAGGAALVIVSGEEILKRLEGKGRPVVRTEPLTPFSAETMFERDDTCLGDTTRLVFVGALLPGKGLQHLLEALAKIEGAVLDVAGTGRAEYMRELRTVAERAGVAGRVTWHGYVADPDVVRDLYRQADIFVLPTLSEGAPRVVWEAMSQSLPVVISDIPPVRAAVSDGVDVLLAPPADPAAIAAAIERLRSDGALRRRLIARGREIAAEKLGRDPVAQAVGLLREHVVPHVRGARV